MLAQRWMFRHQVEPAGFRIAATARYIKPGSNKIPAPKQVADVPPASRNVSRGAGAVDVQDLVQDGVVEEKVCANDG